MSGFVFSADWHLSDRTWAHRPRLSGDAEFSLWQIILFCLEHRLPLIAAGDLFDKDGPDPTAVGGLIRSMDAMQAAGLPVYYIQGQHERSDSPWLGIHKHPTHVDGELFHISGVTGDFYGLDWTPAGQIQDRLTAVPPSVRFLVCHQVWQEHMGSLCHPECDISMVPASVRAVLTGDYHKHQIIEPAAGRFMVSPGSISIRNLAEPVEKAFWHFDGASFRSIPLCTRPVIRRTVVNEAQLADFMTDLAITRAGLRRGDVRILDGEPICHVQFSDELPNAYSRITQAAGESHLFLDEIGKGVKPEAVEVAYAGDDVTLLGCLREVLPSDSDLIPDVAGLLGSLKSPAVAVQELVANWA